MNLSAYFERIGYQGGREATLATLRALHRAHMLAVPFENLDIHVGRWIVLDEARFFNKIVGERRGGFCYEHNGLFFRVLTELGYQVQRLNAQVRRADGGYSMPLSHMALLVAIDGGRWLTDVGFGASFLEPLLIDDPAPQAQHSGTYRIQQDGDTFYYLAQDEQGEWAIQYRFYLQPRELQEYADACHYNQTSPETHFTQKRICSLARPDGRISLRDWLWIETKNGERSERELSSEAEFESTLKEHFGIDLEPARRTADRR